MQQQAAGGNLNTVRTVPNNLHNLDAMPAHTSTADPATIVINDNGEINYEEKTLQSIIGKSKVFEALKIEFKETFTNIF